MFLPRFKMSNQTAVYNRFMNTNGFWSMKPVGPKEDHPTLNLADWSFNMTNEITK